MIEQLTNSARLDSALCFSLLKTLTKERHWPSPKPAYQRLNEFSVLCLFTTFLPSSKIKHASKSLKISKKILHSFFKSFFQFVIKLRLSSVSLETICSRSTQPFSSPLLCTPTRLPSVASTLIFKKKVGTIWKCKTHWPEEARPQEVK